MLSSMGTEELWFIDLNHLRFTILVYEGCPGISPAGCVFASPPCHLDKQFLSIEGICRSLEDQLLCIRVLQIRQRARQICIWGRICTCPCASIPREDAPLYSALRWPARIPSSMWALGTPSSSECRLIPHWMLDHFFHKKCIGPALLLLNHLWPHCSVLLRSFLADRHHMRCFVAWLR